MSQPETRIVRRIQEWMTSSGIFHFKIHGGPYMRVGLPDIVACVEGHFVGLEVKQPGEVATPLQRQVGIEVMGSGGYWFVVHSLGEAKDRIREVRSEVLRERSGR